MGIPVPKVKDPPPPPPIQLRKLCQLLLSMNFSHFWPKVRFSNQCCSHTFLKGFSNSDGKNIKYTYIYKCRCNFMIFFEVYISRHLSCIKSLPHKLKHLFFLVCCCSSNQHLKQYQKFDAIHTESHFNPSSFISHICCDFKDQNQSLGHSQIIKIIQTISWAPLSIYGWFRTRHIVSQGQV